MKRIKIAHLSTDDKFPDQAVTTFARVLSAENDLYIFGKKPFKFIKSEAREVSTTSILSGDLAGQLSSYDVVFVHCLNRCWLKTISKIEGTPIVWVGWGYDYYRIVYPSWSDMLLPRTRARLRWKIFKTKVFGLAARLKQRILFISSEKAISNIAVFCPVLPNEYDTVRSKFRGRQFPAYGAWNYGNLEDDLIRKFPKDATLGDAVLAGNSATPENNHIDLFHALKKSCNRQVISPLSYGDTSYRKIVIAEGTEILGSRFEPVMEYVPIDDYIRLLATCGFAVMNHVRQQALGNIIIMLYLGAKLFLRQECPTYQYLKGIGAVLFTIQDLELDSSLLDEHLDETSVRQNRLALGEHWSREVSDRKTKDLISSIML